MIGLTVSDAADPAGAVTFGVAPDSRTTDTPGDAELGKAEPKDE